jgi:hypothetical protein
MFSFDTLLTLDLWTKMLEADHVHHDKIVENVETMQTSADSAVFSFLLCLLDLFPPSLTLTKPPPLILPRSLALARSRSRAISAFCPLSRSHSRTRSPSAYPVLVTMSNAFGKWHSTNAPPPASPLAGDARNLLRGRRPRVPAMAQFLIIIT